MALNPSPTLGRAMMGAIGALAGLCLWLLVDVLDDQLRAVPRLFLALVAFYGVFFTSLLALLGPLRLRRAGPFAALQGVGVTALVLWFSLRFDHIEQTLESPTAWVAAIILTLIPLPFAIAQVKEGRWSDYSGLFAHSWDIVVRYAAAWVFVGLAWGVVMLSDQLFQLVGIELIEHLLDVDPVPFLLTGTALGVALAVVNELSDYVSPYLVLRLLRLLLPVVLVVMAVFLVALPFRGLSHLFGGFSAAATLMTMAMGATTLITTALDADDSRAVASAPMRVMAQLMALILPALGVLAAVAIWLRVDQYGWTPDRLAASVIAALVLAYGLAYAVSVILRGDWTGHIRRVNMVLALAALVVSAAWLSPLLNAHRISTNSQVDRFEAGQTDVADLDLWLIGREWGRAGQAGLARLQTMEGHPQADVLQQRITRLNDADSRYDFANEDRAVTAETQLRDLADLLQVVPEGKSVPDWFWDGLPLHKVEQLQRACARRTPAQNRGCMVLFADLSDLVDGDEAVVFALSANDSLVVDGYFNRTGRIDTRRANFLGGSNLTKGGAAVLDQLAEGAFALAPVPARVLELGGRQLYFAP
ncbi:hypothetical protein ATO10_11432 [Actibacterium atlanticum]|uniref:DUF4153 domain-containing protein n=1 Tax=Actibacterium atlanticum TaxID=1461693 RepID=A0A058ZL32_9RHOB|nr:DUF4153 domain-containing protein [Actibacterium atlanticum]KCV81521.1 hypothetical protein ATO10_11432 [Actibacterium atlanticum]